VLLMAGLALAGTAAVAFLFPWLLAVPVGVLAGWVGITLLVRSLRLFLRREPTVSSATLPTTPPATRTPPPTPEMQIEPQAAAQGSRPS
jgi:hypothetical protein